MDNKTTGEVVLTIILGVLIVFGLVIAIVPLGCASTPKTHEEWAAKCLKKDGAEFSECLKQWNEWKP